MECPSRWSGSSPPVPATLWVLDPYWDSSWIFCCCPVSWRCCNFGSAGLAPSVLPKIMDG
ncbi:hypothetical protein LEMLEM_LOCUS4761, partial [Lemmus lemmus]